MRIFIFALTLCLISNGSTRAAEEERKPIKALLVLGGCCHDYKAQQKLITEGISARANVEWTIAFDPDTTTTHLNPVYKNAEWAKGYDVIVHDECSADVKDLEIVERILKPHRDGLPAVVLHCGMHSYRTEGFPDKDTPWFQFTGMATTGHGPHEPLSITFLETDSPITRGLKGWTTGPEELYNNIRKPMDTTQSLARQTGQRRHRRRLDQRLWRQEDPRLRHQPRTQQPNRRRRALP